MLKLFIDDLLDTLNTKPPLICAVVMFVLVTICVAIVFVCVYLYNIALKFPELSLLMITPFFVFLIFIKLIKYSDRQNLIMYILICMFGVLLLLSIMTMVFALSVITTVVKNSPM